MSRTESHVGKLQIMHADKELGEACKQVCIDNDIPLKEHYDSYKEMIQDYWHDSFIILGDNVYKILEDTEFDPSEDLFEMEDEGDGIFSYRTQFYNGGCGEQEAIECAYDEMIRRKNAEKRQ